MLKYLMFCGSTATIVEIPPEFTSDQYGELQQRFAEQCGRRGEFASMRRLHDSQRVHGVYFDWWLSGPDGASFELFRMPDTPVDDVKRAAAKIYRDQDVVRMKVLTFKNVVDCPILEGAERLKQD
jgi:hypothetical protein